jgi:hypothetical protein
MGSIVVPQGLLQDDSLSVAIVAVDKTGTVITLLVVGHN